MRAWRRWRRKVECRRKYGDRCPHIERHSPRPKVDKVPEQRRAPLPADAPQDQLSD